MKKMFSYLLPFRFRIMGTVAELFIPFLLSYILDNVIEQNSIRKIIIYGVLMVLCAALTCICNIVANRMAAKVTANFTKAMRSDLFAKTIKLSSKYVDDYTIPSLESRITTDTYNVHNFIGMMQRMGVRAPFLLIGGIGITLFMDSVLALVMIATLPIIFITVYGISRQGVPLYSDVQKSVDSMVRVVREDIQGIRVIKALSKNEYENLRYDKVNLALSKKERKAGTIMSIVNPVMTLLMNLGIAAVVSVAAIRVVQGTSTSATVIAFMQYFTLISMAMMSLSRMFVMYTKCAASAKRITEVLETPERFFVISEEAEGSEYISFENVSFSYFGKSKNLENISFSLKKGESLGIIGATGSGKTTLIKLLLRFYDSDEGKISINNKSIKEYTKDELTSIFGVAMQNDFLYAETIEENIRFGRDILFENVERAAKIAQAHDFITAFLGGYQHKVASKGTNISGGQRQRLFIARAIANEPEILILDDSSSALDYKTDANLRKALKENLKGTTVITVAQRVSSVKDCDLILVLEEGRIIGSGKHQQLLENCPEYREISDSQMGGAIID